jgi:hypothetical protein
MTEKVTSKTEKEQVAELDEYTATMRMIRKLDASRKEIKKSFHENLAPGQTMIGHYRITSEEVETQRMKSAEASRATLIGLGYEDEEIVKIISALINTGTSRQFLVRYNPV